MNSRDKFYEQNIRELIVGCDSSILVAAGGEVDKNIFLKNGYTNVVISNLDSRMKETEFSPYSWSYQNLEKLTYQDNMFDYVIVHEGLHHCPSPHRALLEMYRVARIGILAIESRDSFVMKIVAKLNFTQTYEHSAVFHNECSFGGVNNSEVPNFIYRWNENEIQKTISSFAPYARHRFVYKYASSLPCTPKYEKKAFIKKLLINLLVPIYHLFVFFFPKQQNLFAFFVYKPILPQGLQPWLKADENGSICFNRQWGEDKYKPI